MRAAEYPPPASSCRPIGTYITERLDLERHMVAMAAEDRFALQDLVNKYAIYCDTRRLEETAGLFVADAIFDERQLGFGIFQGRDNILSYYEDAMAAWNIAHFMTNHVIETWTGDTASGVSFAHVECRPIGAGEARSVYVIYRDEYVKENGEWLFRSRTVSPLLPIDTGSTAQ